MATSRAMRIRTAVAFAECDFRGQADCLPEIEGCGFFTWTPRRPQRIGAHAHRHWEVCLLVRGAHDWWLEEEYHLLRSGDLFLSRPGERHVGSDSLRHSCGMAWLCLAAPLDRLPGLAAEDRAALAAGFAGLRARRFAASPTTIAAFADLVATAVRADPLRVVATRSLVHRLLAAVLVDHRAHLARPDAGAAPGPAVARALAILRERVAAPISVAALARAVGVSRTVLHDRFVAEVGIAPIAWWTQLRIERAKELLRAGERNAAVAAALGFASAQHFARVFKAAAGATPRGWLAKQPAPRG